ncbi:MAG: Rieske 2Fe-2S domain-containing protein [Polyangiaceae bacterium]
MTREVALLDLDELWIGEGRAVRHAALKLFVVRLDDRVSCYEDRCPHLGFPLSEGRLDGETLVCAAHGWEFDVKSGIGKNPQKCRLSSLPVSVREGRVWLQVEDEA